MKSILSIDRWKHVPVYLRGIRCQVLGCLGTAVWLHEYRSQHMTATAQWYACSDHGAAAKRGTPRHLMNEIGGTA